MKRGSGHRQDGAGSGDDEGTNIGNLRSQRRRRRQQQMVDSDASVIQNSAQSTHAADISQPSQVGVQRTATRSIHSIDTLGENVNLPDYVREHNSTLTFPEKLMLTLTHVDRERRKSGIPESGECIGWVADGTAFVVQDIEKLCATWLPMFFGQSKFSSFTRKMYRWGFRKINVASIPNGSSYNDNALFFGNEHFLRSDKSQLSLMKSVTAAKTRSGVIGTINRTMEHHDHSESEVDESKPQAIDLVAPPTNPSIGHQIEPSIASLPSGDDMMSLLQQSANLSYLLSLLAANPHTSIPVNQAPIIQNPMLVESMRLSSISPQVFQMQSPYMNQVLQQFAASAALMRTPGIAQQNPLLPTIPQTTPQNIATVPWLINSCIQMAQQQNQIIPQPLIQSWPVYPNRQDVILQQAAPQNLQEQERLRGVMNTFLRYCESLQQQQQSSRNPQTLLTLQQPPAPPPPPPPPSDQSRQS